MLRSAVEVEKLILLGGEALSLGSFVRGEEVLDLGFGRCNGR